MSVASALTPVNGYSSLPSRAQEKALRRAVSNACDRRGIPCAVRSRSDVEVGIESSSATHARDVRGWASVIAFAKNCPDACAVIAIARQVSVRPLRYVVVSLFGPTGGVAWDCYAAFWGGPWFAGDTTNHQPIASIRRLPGAVVWTFHPDCSLDRPRAVDEFYRRAS